MNCALRTMKIPFPRPIRDMRPHIYIYLFYFLLTLVIALPVLRAPASRVFAGHGDALLYISWIWWFKTAWLQGIPSDPNPMLAAPFGTDWGGVVEKGTIWPGIVLSTWVNEVFALNFLVLLSFPLAAIAAYHLTLYLTASRSGAFISGLIYSFSPYHLWKSWAWIPLSNIQWLAFYVLALFRWRRKRRIKDAVIAGVLFAVTLLCSYNYGLVAIAFTFLWIYFELMVAFVSKRKIVVDRETWKHVVVAVVVAALLTLPIIYPILMELLALDRATAPTKRVWPLGDFYILIARFTDYFLPPTSSWFYPLFEPIDAPTTIRGDFTNGLFLGYSTLLLVGVAVWKWCKGTEPVREGERFSVSLLAVTLLVFLVFSLLPPTLEMDLPVLGEFVLKGPGYLGYLLAPWFREYARFGVMVLLAAAVLAGFGVRYLLDRWPQGKSWILGLTGLGLLVDFGFNTPELFPLTINTKNPPAVYQWLAKQPREVTIAEYPMLGWSQVSPVYLYYGTVHGKRIANGYGFSRKADEITPALINLSEPQVGEVLRFLGVDYLVWHRRYPEFPSWYGTVPRKPIDEEDFEFVRGFDTAEVYRVRANPARVIVTPRRGFRLAGDGGNKSAWWWISDVGQIQLVNLTEEHLKIRLEFEVASQEGRRRVMAYDSFGKAIRLDAAVGVGEINEKRVVLGPLWIAPSRLMENNKPKYTPVILRPVGKGNEPVGVRNFRIEELQ